MTPLQNFLNTDISRLVRGGVENRGDFFGLELECEGKAVDWDGKSQDLLKFWIPHKDGSLRDNHGTSCEWVFIQPMSFNIANKAVDTLFEYFNKRKSKIVTSNRTSTHIHFNMGDKKAYQLVNLFLIFTALEDVLDSFCGEDRRGNLFCLSSRHAEAQIRWMERCCFTDFNFITYPQEGRYCSLNLAALNKFGSVEFRGMRGLDNVEDVKRWLSIINDLTQYACYKMRNPVDIIENISRVTPVGFLKEVFSEDNFVAITSKVPFDVILNSVYDGLRLIQIFAYKVGTEFDKVVLAGKDYWAGLGEDKEPDINVEIQAKVLGQVREANPAPDPFLIRLRDAGNLPEFANRIRMIEPFEMPQEFAEIDEGDDEDE